MSDKTKKRGRGRPGWQPPDLKVVEELAAKCLTLDQVARLLGISLRTLLRKKRESSQFRQALEDGRATAISTMSTLREMAMNGDAAAPIFRLTARVGWRDSDVDGVGVNVTIETGRGATLAELDRARIEWRTRIIGQGNVPERMQSLGLLGRAVLRPFSQDAPAMLSEPGKPSVAPADPSLRSRQQQVQLHKPPNSSTGDSAPGGVVLPQGICPKCGRRPLLGEEPGIATAVLVGDRRGLKGPRGLRGYLSEAFY